MATEYRQNTNNDEFKNDPEANEDSKKYRLPFALCKKYGIPIQDWWTPRNAWDALKRGGEIENVSEEYKNYYREKKKERQKEYNKKSRVRNKHKKEQLANPLHNPDKNYKHQNGKIAGVAKGKPMNFEQADSGNCNPYFGKGLIGYKTNCQTCVATYVARRQGYNVRALPNLNNKNIDRLSYNSMLAYVLTNGKNPSKQYKEKGVKLKKFLESNVQKNKIYAFGFRYTGKNSGHIITCEINKSGKIQIYDPQSNEKMSIDDFASFYGATTAHYIADLSDCKINESFCDSIMIRR